MGSGKSTLGKQLAEILHRPFLDLDRMIEKQQGKTIAEIFQNEGENKFREIESNTLRDLVSQPAPVVALGGGTVCFGKNLEIIKTHGLLIYISVPADELTKRLENSAEARPLLKGKEGIALMDHVSKLLKERLPYYTKAHITIEGVKINASQIHQAIVETN